MASILADINVWLATLVADHPHHAAATRWWRDDVLPTDDRVGLCRLTQLGLLRLLSNERVMGPRRLDHARAWAALKEVAAQPRVDFLQEPPGLDELLAAMPSRGHSSPNFWSDAYLAAFARTGGHRLTSFDRGFSRFADLDLLLLQG